MLYPFDDVYQSAFFLPWAMVAVDEARGTEVQLAFLRFEDSVTAFRRMCREAASFRAEDEEVVAAQVRGWERFEAGTRQVSEPPRPWTLQSLGLGF